MNVAHPSVRARAFDAWDDYERFRPGYPPALLDLIAEQLGLPADAALVDLGAGTGKVARSADGRAFEAMLVVHGIGPTDQIDVPYLVDCWIARRSEA